ncbi:uncharacterized protein PHACADRAFT_188604 [Phanerochaete carnosa HHB-10118-sp]|uniref:Uncharacterized protein n=1 Tax=Phanerochaete carnosa (strain HHB-10118-sp) TaxID=650164 RepID=K5VEC8_PHACS|nr:uncharacterized protein PHACADRAFT_188604 [Phanerochaete carnosa HHB-10118-sp]EKM49503.1 hypothetical protein PHACADRAFT_188604 [Phanerochaete carnosa HHB-10118-sp]
MLVKDRKKEIARLNTVGIEGEDKEFEWERENNIARLKLLQLQLNLGAGPTGPKAPDATCRAGAKDKYVPSDPDDMRLSPPNTRLRAAISQHNTLPSSSSLPLPSPLPTPSQVLELSEPAALAHTQLSPSADAASTNLHTDSPIQQEQSFSAALVDQIDTSLDHPHPNTVVTNATESVVNEQEDSVARPLGLQAGGGSSEAIWALKLDKMPDGGRWITPIYTSFVREEIVSDMQATWRQLLNDWVQLEAAMEFAYALRRFTAAGRPKEVAWWVGRAQKPWFHVEQSDQSTYSNCFTQWWSACNPEWRTRNADGHPVPPGTRDWSTMLIPSANGICQIIACLVGLSIATDIQSWSRSMRDVHWMVGELLEAVENGASAPAKEPSKALDAPTAKGQKRKDGALSVPKAVKQS